MLRCNQDVLQWLWLSWHAWCNSVTSPLEGTIRKLPIHHLQTEDSFLFWPVCPRLRRHFHQRECTLHNTHTGIKHAKFLHNPHTVNIGENVSWCIEWYTSQVMDWITSSPFGFYRFQLWYIHCFPIAMGNYPSLALRRTICDWFGPQTHF